MISDFIHANWGVFISAVLIFAVAIIVIFGIFLSAS